MRCLAHHRLIAVIALSGMGQLIVACGQKGELYLPEPKPARQTTAGTEADAVRQMATEDEPAVKAGPAAHSGSGQSGQE